MKRLLLSLLMLVGLKAQGIPFPGGGLVHAVGNTFTKCRTLTVDHTKVPNTDQTSMAVWFHSPVGTVNTVTTAVTRASGDNFYSWMDAIDIAGTTYTFTYVSSTTGTLGSSAGTQTGATFSGTPYFKTVANGGLVQNTVAQSGGGSGLTVPADLVVASNSTGSTKLPFEWETYSSTTGAANFWYTPAALTTASDTVSYVCYGSAGTTTYQGNVNSTWNSAAQAVWHFPDGSSLGINDSTVNAHNGTLVSSPTAVAGQIDGAIHTSSGNSLTGGASNGYTAPTTVATLSVWFKTAASGSTLVSPIVFLNGASTGFSIRVNNTVGHVCGGFRNGANAFTCLESTGSTYNDGAWHKATWVISGANGSLYVDNASADTVATVNDSNSFTWSAANVTIGGGASFDLDELRFATAARSADWVTTEYNNQTAPNTFLSVGN